MQLTVFIALAIVAFGCGKKSDPCVGDCSEMVLVSAGPFMMGCNALTEGTATCTARATADELPLRAVYLDGFLIDKHELSRSKYKRCVDAKACTANGDDPADELPVAVNWAQAAAYCKWAGKRLPTEAEWEKTARGPDGRLFPWGNAAPRCELAQYSHCSGGYVAVDSLPRGASPYGALNMAGNISEWVADQYRADYYATSAPSNPPGPTDGEGMVLRGGNGVSPVPELRVANRAHKVEGRGRYGVRCVRPLHSTNVTASKSDQ